MAAGAATTGVVGAALGVAGLGVVWATTPIKPTENDAMVNTETKEAI